MRILTYKRTHVGDPDQKGRFGIYNCMGNVRSYDYDAVIGIGGIGWEPRSFGIDRKINWVGIGPTRSRSRQHGQMEVTFNHFLLLDDRGPFLEELAPLLAKRMYGKGIRILLSDYSAREQAEAEEVLKWSRRQSARKLSGKSQLSRRSGCSRRCKRLNLRGGC